MLYKERHCEFIEALVGTPGDPYDFAVGGMYLTMPGDGLGELIDLHFTRYEGVANLCLH